MSNGVYETCCQSTGYKTSTVCEPSLQDGFDSLCLLWVPRARQPVTTPATLTFMPDLPVIRQVVQHSLDGLG